MLLVVPMHVSRVGFGPIDTTPNRNSTHHPSAVS
jgi:hypothetical protein